jgi:hypothetical protein
MIWKTWFVVYCSCAVLSLALDGDAQSQSQKPISQSSRAQSVVVPAQVAALIRPILDEEQKSGPHAEKRLGNLLYGLTQKKGRVADEALVVLMCFYVGESQEETDAVIGRGRRMLPYLKKYGDGIPIIHGRRYPDSMLKGYSRKVDAFESAVQAIKKNLHSSADDPEGAA